MTPPRMDQEARARLVNDVRRTVWDITVAGVVHRMVQQIEADGKRIADLEAMEARAIETLTWGSTDAYGHRRTVAYILGEGVK